MSFVGMATPAAAGTFEYWPSWNLQGEALKDAAYIGDDKAYQLQKQKAEAGDVQAMLALGKYEGDRRQGAAALAWFQRAAAAGEGRGSLMAGIVQIRGWQGDPSDPKGALAAFQQAAARRNAAGTAMVGWCYERGLGVAYDPAQALAWYEQARQLGSPFATGLLAALLEEGRGTKPDLARAAKLYEELRADASWGRTATIRLGLLLARGPGGAEDYVRARELLEPILNEREASLAVAKLYDRGLGTPRDAHRAASFYYESMDLPEAQLGLARLYAKGEAVEHSPKEALRLARLAAGAGLEEARTLVGQLLAQGVDPVEGYRLLAQAQHRGDAEAGKQLDAVAKKLAPAQLAAVAFEVALAFEKEPPAKPRYGPDGSLERPDWFGYYLQAANAGNPKAMGKLASVYLATPGFPPDWAQARKWSLQAYRLGDKASAGTLLMACSNGPLADVLPEIQGLAAAGDVHAQALIGHAMYQGNRGLPLDQVQAFVWLKRAALGGDPSAALMVGGNAAAGSVIPKDLELARTCYVIAATHGIPHAMYLLGQLAATPGEAYAYYAMGADADSMCAKAAQPLLAKLTPEEHEAARKVAAEWVGKHGGVPARNGRLVPMKAPI